MNSGSFWNGNTMNSSTSSDFSRERIPDFLRAVYARFHKPEFIDPDPLLPVKRYAKTEDREIAALVCSSLALGRVASILSACEQVLGSFGPRLKEELLSSGPGDLRKRLAGFRYRFFDTEMIASFLGAAADVVRDYGSLEACFSVGIHAGRGSLLSALGSFVDAFRRRSVADTGILLSDPGRGGAVKRLNLFLRWMVRKDSVDPGGWTAVGPEKLLVPLDTHMHSFALELGLIGRRQADLKAVLELTEAFREIDPRDPVRFDFSLSRLGLHPEGKYLRKTLLFDGNFSDHLR